MADDEGKAAQKPKGNGKKNKRIFKKTADKKKGTPKTGDKKTPAPVEAMGKTADKKTPAPVEAMGTTGAPAGKVAKLSRKRQIENLAFEEVAADDEVPLDKLVPPHIKLEGQLYANRHT